MDQRGRKGDQLRQVSSPGPVHKALKTLRSEMFILSSEPGAGGAASEALDVLGLRADDEIMAVTQRVAGASNTAMIEYGTQVADSLTVGWTADPGAGAVVDVLVRRKLLK